MSYFLLNNLTKRYDSNLVLNNINLSIEQGTFLSLLGPSGCGKTTTLKIVAGFESPDAGEVVVAGEVYNQLPVYRRNVGMVFQSYALFPHMTVAQNIAFGLEQRQLDPGLIKKQVAEAIDMVQLTGFEKRKPSQLSGGQQQRVALARALVIRPRLLLLDESLSALDKKLRVDMQVELRQIQKYLGITTIFVTHDQEEALTLSDKIAVMKNGNIIQLDTPHAIYEKPGSTFVAGFLGQSNFFQVVVKALDQGRYCLELGNGEQIRLPAGAAAGRQPGAACILAVRPERISLAAERPAGKDCLCGRVKFITYAGNISNFRVEVMGSEVIVQLQNSFSGERFKTGDEVYLTWDPAGSVLLDE
ncbi:ABC transporter ATP-binding protein [Sporomusa termitida]|uniref:Spermidine/putrescine import ATP-binding protein PotA n=1 Tax=Sporomusa termitida TaxID=2377 RepID=A0A517DUX4_9FIRM|nr:ABC transporter ATP-binding protein [Sporomusa termitida]QDR81155.1 Spermidine/putrescine import ATP-binding protein PotA [Sporomusa termitida]